MGPGWGQGGRRLPRSPPLARAYFPVPVAARTIATMPARTASGSRSQAATTAARSGSAGSAPVVLLRIPSGAPVALSVARRVRFGAQTPSVGARCRADRPEDDGAEITDREGACALPCASGRAPSPLTGEGLEPSTNGLTYLIGFHRPPQPGARNSLGRLPCRRDCGLSVWTIPSPSQACRV
jgi:hypothetical protein